MDSTISFLVLSIIFMKKRNIYLVGKKNIAIFAPAIKTIGVFRGAFVQLVRMPACHAGGHEFESRTHRFTLPIVKTCINRVR